MKLVNLGAGYTAPQFGTQDFDDISNTITDSFRPALMKVPGFYQIRLDDFRR